MAEESNIQKKDERRPVEKLIGVADAIFDRATKLDAVKLTKKDEEAELTIKETRDEGFIGCIAVWRIIIDMLPNSGLDFNNRKELEIDAHKVISRCHHRLNNLEKAKAAITQAIDLGYLDGFISLGAVCMDMDDFDGAETAFKTALAKDVQIMRAHAGLGELYFQRGTDELKKGTGGHEEWFTKAEEQFMAAGKERFEEVFEHAMELFDKIGWKEQAASFGEKAAQYYSENRLVYGDKLRSLDAKLRRMAGAERYERILAGLGRTLGDIVGGRERDPNR